MLSILHSLGKAKLTQQEKAEIIQKFVGLIQQKSLAQAKGTCQIKSNLDHLASMIDKLEDNQD